MTAQEILNRLPEIFKRVKDFAYETNWKDSNNTGIGNFEEVGQYGGEGQGDTWYSVKFFPSHGIYIRVNGFYSSYEGTEFEDGLGEEVKPQQKTVTVYESIS